MACAAALCRPGQGAAMVIEPLALYYHIECFRCCVCYAPLGTGERGTDVRVRASRLHCQNCYSSDEGITVFGHVPICWRPTYHQEASRVQVSFTRSGNSNRNLSPKLSISCPRIAPVLLAWQLVGLHVGDGLLSLLQCTYLCKIFMIMFTFKIDGCWNLIHMIRL